MAAECAVAWLELTGWEDDIAPDGMYAPCDKLLMSCSR